jgi:hypothetical protein
VIKKYPFISLLKGGSNNKEVLSPLEGEGKGEGGFDNSFSGQILYLPD